MQPHIILDKSVFQELGIPEFTPLDRYFKFVIPPILLREIIGDVAADDRDPAGRVANFAGRFGLSSVICQHHEQLVLSSLLGDTPPMNGRTVPVNMQAVVRQDGAFGYQVVHSADQASLLRWEERVFLPEEIAWAERWRKRPRVIRTNFYVKTLARAGVVIQKPKNLDHLRSVVDEIFRNPAVQGKLLYLIFTEFNVPQDRRATIIKMWFAARKPLLEVCAPYAAFCIRANLFLAIGGLSVDVLGKPDQHDLRDLEYCYYLPFCEVFATTDRKHRKLVQLLIRGDQLLVGVELRPDLQRFAGEWETMSDEEKKAHHLMHWFQPTPHDASIICQIWERFRPDYDPGRVIVPKHDGQLHRAIKELWRRRTQPTSEVSGTKARFVKSQRPVNLNKVKELFPHADLTKI
jgi:hypothetical protein